MGIAMVALAPVVVLLGIYSWQMLRKRRQRDAYWISERRGRAALGGGTGYGLGAETGAGSFGGFSGDHGGVSGGYCDSGGFSDGSGGCDGGGS